MHNNAVSERRRLSLQQREIIHESGTDRAADRHEERREHEVRDERCTVGRGNKRGDHCLHEQVWEHYCERRFDFQVDRVFDCKCYESQQAEE